ncbi:MAG: endonuclease MutS2 [Cyanobacteriota bacterium]|nr:endonuclease MutS2 [Cyanobacteriota bacterium]
MDDQLLTETLHLLEWPRLCLHLSTFAATKIGVLACQHWDPWRSWAETEVLLDETQEAIQLDSTLPGGLSMQGIHDLLPHLERAERGGVLQGSDLIQIAATLASARRVRRTIDDRPQLPRLQALLGSLRTYPELEQAILQSLDEQGTLRDSASPTLQSLRQQGRQRRQQIQAHLQRLIADRPQAIQDSGITQRQGRYVVAVKASHRDQVRGLIHDTSQSGATLYVEPYNTVDLNNHLKQEQAAAHAEEQRILQDLSQQVAAVSPDLEALQGMMIGLDLALARGRYSLWLEGNRPQFVATGWRLRRVRHPLLLWQTQHDDSQAVIPVNVTLRPQIRVAVITGPNTGGKTVTLKTLGLLVLMAKAGLYIPAQDPAELPWFSTVYADIGDEQSLQQSLSTFSGHIRRISRILQSLAGIEANSALVLLDEVGAGTDPVEGSALAAALLLHLADQAPFTLATTHYGELKALKYQDARFENASVEFDEATLAPTYRLLWGIPGRSNALTIARRLQLDEGVIAQAQARLTGEVTQVDSVVIGLEQQRAEWERKTQEAESLHRQLEALQQEMQSRSQRLAEREAHLEQEKNQTIQSAIQNARAEIAAVIRRLQQGDPSAQAAQKATQELETIQQRHLSPPPVSETEFFPEVGDRVRLQGLHQIGEVIAINGDELMVRSGILKFTLTLSQIAPLDDHQAKQRQRPKPSKTPTPSSLTPVTIRTRHNTLDLRGKNVAEATHLLENRLAEAPAGSLWLIHGHGTGKLRMGVQEFLRSHPRVVNMAAADAQDGGAGVTVAQLR